MIDFAELGRLNFKEQSALATLDGILGEVASFAETRTAAEIATSLTKKAEADPSLGPILAPFIAKFRVLALPVLTDQQATSVFASIGSILSDERIGLYERLRARILVLPQSRREPFCQAVLIALRASQEKIGTIGTISSWVSLVEQSTGSSEDFVKRPEFVGLDDATDHTLRHLIHVMTLLRSPDQHAATAVQRTTPAQKTPVVPPAAPMNLPVAPVAPVIPPAQAIAVPPKAPAAPSVSAVIARLHASEAESAGPSAVAHLTPDDEQEIEGHTERLETLDAGPNVHDTLMETIEQMITDLNLSFAEDNLRRRFSTIMTARLKDIRNASETTELLTRDPKVGGLGFDAQLAEKISQQASKVAATFHDESEVRRMAERQKAADASPMPKPPKVPVAPEPVAAPVAAAPLPVTPQPAPWVPTTPLPQAIRPPVAQAPAAFRNDVSQIVPGMSKTSMRTSTDGRPTVSDIRGTSRLTGPIEELRQMTLADYRRLGPDPVSVIRRVYEKIQRLGKESFTKRAEGIKAWRESDVYKLYIAMGHEALGAGKTIRDVSLVRQQQGQASLAEQEFTLIADLNRKLRF